jgi:hypothetical protein
MTYPNGALVLTGDAAAIARAFNGGIFTSTTGDDGTAAGGAQAGGTTYYQDAVDAIVWTGPGNFASPPTDLGNLVVPPGKTLFIGGSLALDGAGASDKFLSIAVSDSGTISDTLDASVRAAGSGGSKVDSTAGKLVILAGANITDDSTAATMTIGGELELHRGAGIDFTSADSALVTTAGSKTYVYGTILDGDAGLTFGGDLIILNGGSVTGGSSTADKFNGPVEVYGDLTPSSVAGVTFAKTLKIGSTGTLTTANNITANGAVTVSKVTTLPAATSRSSPVKLSEFSISKPKGSAARAIVLAAVGATTTIIPPVPPPRSFAPVATFTLSSASVAAALIELTTRRAFQTPRPEMFTCDELVSAIRVEPASRSRVPFRVRV